MPSSESETDGRAPAARLLPGCFADGGFGRFAARFAAAGRGKTAGGTVHATARATVRAASSAVAKEPRRARLPSLIKRAWYRKPLSVTPL